MEPMRLVYFGIRGRAEVIRLLLLDQGIPFEDSTISEDEWQGLKKDYIYGQIPCLFEGDKQIVQTGAILRHLARKLNLYGSTEDEKLHLDIFYEGLRDLHEKYIRLIYTEYEEKKAEFINTVYPSAWAVFETLLQKFGDGTSVLGNGKLSFVDYVLWEELDIALLLDPHCLDSFEALRRFHERFSQRPNIQKRIEARLATMIPVNGNGKQ
uniref:Glutathione S-transferase n=1 Tax=Steinernema glaseri TaxID=37863 RepID=A0A1I7Z371_9BILA